MKLAASLIVGLGLWAILAVPHSGAQTSRGDAVAGKEVFEAQCMSCHNADSTEEKDGPGLKGVKSGKLPSGARATRESILEIIDKGRQGMPPFQDILKDVEKENVTAYVLTL